jgi:hypothetical protein
MKNWFFVSIVFIVLVFSGCAVTLPPPSETSPVAEESGKFPSTYGPLGKNHKSIQTVNELFQRVETLRKADRFTEAELQSVKKVSRFSPIIVSGCDLEVLKAFVATNWAPVIVARSPVGPKHVRVVVGYDDSSQRITLVEPMEYAPAVISYEDFLKQWDDPQKTCLLVFSENPGKDRIENALRKYLPEKMKSLSVVY